MAMTAKERWRAAVRLEPVDRLPFWPKILDTYADDQPAPFNSMTLTQIHDWIGSDRFEGMPSCVKTVRTSSSHETVRVSPTERRVIYRVGKKELVLVNKFDGFSKTWHPVEFPIRRLEDFDTMIAFYRDWKVELDRDALARNVETMARHGQNAMVGSCIGVTPLMHFVQWLVTVEDCHYFLADNAARVEELFDAMQAVELRSTEIMAEHSPADILFFNENTSTTLISPAQYRMYCLPHIMQYADVLTRAGRLWYLHMCGTLKALLPDLARIPVHAFEAFTSPPIGNTTLAHGRSGCPDTCLIGGTNATLWTQPASDVIAKLEDDLAALPHHRGLVVTSAGRMPDHIRPDKIKRVCDWVRVYPMRQ